jgi:conjugal transfer ATP-binding protein TraC
MKNVLLKLADWLEDLYARVTTGVMTTVFNANLRLQLRQWDLYKNSLVSDERIMEMGIRLKLVSTTFQGSQHVATLHWVIQNCLRFVVPERERLRLYVRSTPASPEAVEAYEGLLQNAHPTARLRTQNVGRFFRAKISRGELIDYDVFLMLSHQPEKKRRHRSCDTFVLEEQYAELSKTVHALTETLRLNFSAEVLSQDELFSLCHSYFNPFASSSPRYQKVQHYTPPHLLKKFPFFGEETLREQLTRTPFRASVSPPQMDGGYFSILTLTGPPSGSTSPNKAHALLQHQTNFWLVVDYQHQDFQQARETLQTRRERFGTFVRGQQEKGKTGDSEKGFASEQASAARIFIEKTGAHPYKVALSLLLYDEDRSRLLHGVEASRRSLVNAFGVKPKNPFFTQAAQFFALSPGSGKSNRTAYDMLDLNAADYFPYNAPWQGSKKPRVLFASNWDTVIPYDFFDPALANGNAIFFGGSGKGKSVLVQKLLAEALKEDLEVYIVDQKADYKTLVEFYGGVHYTVSLDGGSIRNPFDLEEGELGPTPDKLSRLKLDIQALAESNGHKLSDLHVALLEEGLKQTYQRKLRDRVVEGEIKRELDTPILRDLVEQLRRLNYVNGKDLSDHDRTAALELVSKLARWTGNTPQGRFIDRPTVQRPTAPISYYDISGMRSYDELKLAGALMVFGDIWKRLDANPDKRKIVIVEEVWGLFDVEATARYLTDIPKLIRSKNGVFWAVTQEPKDLHHPKAKSILSNTTIRWSLQLTDRDQLQVLKDMVGLNDETVTIIENLVPRKEAFVWLNKDSGNEGDVVRVELTPEEYWLSTTHPAEAHLRHTLLARNKGDIKVTIEALAKSYPNGTKHLDLRLEEAA